MSWGRRQTHRLTQSKTRRATPTTLELATAGVELAGHLRFPIGPGARWSERGATMVKSKFRCALARTLGLSLYDWRLAYQPLAFVVLLVQPTRAPLCAEVGGLATVVGAPMNAISAECLSSLGIADCRCPSTAIRFSVDASAVSVALMHQQVCEPLEALDAVALSDAARLRPPDMA